MKRLTALFLALVMLLPMTLVATAEELDPKGKYSSFEENFDAYPDGQITNHTMNNAYGWGYGIVNGTANIRNKALALSGTATFQNVVIPGQIYAGKSYAKEQVWQITVTIPEGLSADAAINLLNYTGNQNTKAKDMGIKFQDGKFYHGTLDGVTVNEVPLLDAAPGTYTVQRVMHMQKSGKFTCDIYVLDASGKEVAGAHSIPCPSFSSISSISFSVENADKEILLDDYKLFSAVVEDAEEEDTAQDIPDIKYRTYLENFDTYPDGQMTSYKMNNSYAWGYGIVGGSSNIRNKALVLTGTVSYHNLHIPAQIIGGDTYAKDQTWELTVTIPEGLSEKSEILLLRYEAKGTPVSEKGIVARDGGIRIVGNTLYYSALLDKDDPVKIRTEYVELCKLNPGAYTVKRVMDMNDAKNFTYSLSVLAPNGTEVAKVKDVDCPYFTAITSIGFITDKVDKEVIFDDYKISATGVAADLTVKDAATGKAVDTAEPYAGNAAYHLSWFNGTAQTKQLFLAAAIYENGKVIEKKNLQELTMEPGASGVENGTVEVAEGQSVEIYIRDPDAERAQRKRVITLAVMAGVLLVVLVLVVIALVKHGKKAKVIRDAKRKAFFDGEDV